MFNYVKEFLASLQNMNSDTAVSLAKVICAGFGIHELFKLLDKIGSNKPEELPQTQETLPVTQQ